MVGEALVGVFLEELGDDPREPRRHRLGQLGDRRRDVARDHVDDRIAVEGRAPREEVVEGRAQRVEVGAVVEGAPLALLRRHIIGAPDQPPLGHLGIGDGLGEAEVGDLHAAIGAPEDVRGLDVSVDDPRPIRGAQAPGDLQHHPAGLFGIEGLAPLQDVVEGAALDALHREVEHPPLIRGGPGGRLGATIGDEAGPSDVVDAHDVRALQLRLGARLLLQPLLVSGAAEHVAQHLERDRPIQAEVAGAIDGAHAADAEHRLDPVVVDLGPDEHLRLAPVRALRRQRQRGLRLLRSLPRVLPLAEDGVGERDRRAIGDSCGHGGEGRSVVSAARARGERALLSARPFSPHRPALRIDETCMLGPS